MLVGTTDTYYFNGHLLSSFRNETNLHLHRHIAVKCFPLHPNPGC